MRGKVQEKTNNLDGDRITPAYAGKRIAAGICHAHRLDHPRLCGEKANFDSSFELSQRITPAYAGKRNRCNRSYIKHRDHPRLCGEKLRRPWEMQRFPGSPPPMRGKVAGEHINEIRAGITPAYAGKR